MTSTEGQRTSKLALRFFSNASLYGVGAVLVRFGTFLVLPIYWQLLSPEDFGRIALAQMIAALLATIYDLGMSGSVQRHYFEWRETDRPHHLAAVWSFSILFSFALSLIFSVSAPFLQTFFTEEIAVSVLLLGIWTAFFQNFGMLPFSLCRIQERLPLFSVLSMGQFLSQTVMILVFLVYFKMGYAGYLWGTLVGTMIYAVASLVFIFKEIRFPWRWWHLREPLYYALPTLPAGILDGVGAAMDRFFLQKYVPLSELGLYSLSRQFGQAFNFFQGTLKNSWIPLVYRIVAERKDAPKVLSRVSSYYLMALSLPALAIATLSEDIIYLINKPEYFGVASYVPAMVAGFFLWGIGNIYGRGLDLAKKTQYYWIMYGGSFVSNLFLLMLWAPQYGAWGAVGAFFVSGLIREALQIGLAYYFYPRPLEWKPIVSIFVIQGFAFWVCSQLMISTGWIAIIVKCGIVAVSSLLSLLMVVGVQGFKRMLKGLRNRSKKISIFQIFGES